MDFTAHADVEQSDGGTLTANQTIGLYRENAIAIEIEARYPFGGNAYYVTMQITFPIPEFARKERNLHCDVLHYHQMGL